MTVWQAVVLGIVQGVTEFLPVSSSGHLVIVQQLLGITEHALTFDVMVHAGSLLAIVVALRSELALMVKGFLGLFRAVPDPEAARGRRLLWQTAVATVPLAAAGLLFRDAVDQAFSSALVPVVLLFATGALALCRRGAPARRRGKHGLVPRHLDGSGPGAGGAARIVPLGRHHERGHDERPQPDSRGPVFVPDGHSRHRRGHAAGTAGPVGRPHRVRGRPDVLVVGAVSSAVTSYLVIRLFLRFVRRGRLAPFAYYTWVLGAVMLWLL